MKRVHPLPTLLTLGNFGSGFVAIMLAARGLMTNQNFQINPFGTVNATDLVCLACGCIFLGMIFDMLDGKVARMTGSACEFGGEMDSLADVCTFGIAPAAILTLNWLRVEPEGARWWSMALGFGFIYAALAAIRLARYNVESDISAKDYFKGLPSPAAAGALASLFLFLHSDWIHPTLMDWLAPAEVADRALAMQMGEQTLTKIQAVYMLIMGFLMVTRVRYAHFSNKMLGGRKRITHLVACLVPLMLFFVFPSLVLMLAFNGYVLYGLLRPVLSPVIGRLSPSKTSATEEPKQGPILHLKESSKADTSDGAEEDAV